MHARFAPKATVGDQTVIRRHMPKSVITRIGSSTLKIGNAGAPHEVVVGELIKLAIKAAVHLRGKKKGPRDVQDLVKRCFAAIGPEEEARLRRGLPH